MTEGNRSSVRCCNVVRGAVMFFRWWSSIPPQIAQPSIKNFLIVRSNVFESDTHSVFADGHHTTECPHFRTRVDDGDLDLRAEIQGCCGKHEAASHTQTASMS